MDKSCLEIPYRFESVEILFKAKEENLLGLGDNYQKIIEVAQRESLSIPSALEKALKMVKKDFYMLKPEDQGRETR